MAKTYLSTVKYIIKVEFTVDGIVDKHDVIGAVFGQSEGLIGEEMDLKELQKNGKLGRIEVEIQAKSGKSSGTLTVPSSLDKVQTSVLAAAIETVDKVGPCNSSFKAVLIQDARRDKRKGLTERAKQLLMQMNEEMPETQELTEEIRFGTRTAKVREIGRDKVAIGPEVDSSDELVLVEGRADVLTLLKHGIKNAAAVGGAKVPRTIENLARGKTTVAFVDGDRGGDLVARQLSQTIKLDFIAKAPDGKEVEELTLKEILAALRKRSKASEFLREKTSLGPMRAPPIGARPERRPSYREKPWQGRKPSLRGRPPRGGFSRPRRRPFEEDRSRDAVPIARAKPNDIGAFSEPMKEINDSLKARFLDEKMKTVKEVNVRELLKEMSKHKGASSVVLDGIITKRLLEEAEKNEIKQLVGVKKGKIEETGKVKVSTLY